MSISKSDREALQALNWKNPLHILAFGFGAGLSPKMPGTMGTLVAIPLYLLLVQFPPVVYFVLTLIFSVAGIYICGKTAQDLQVHDHGGIVWDEIVGFFLTMLFLPVTITNIILGFLLFRLFDIWKPWPIRWCDRRVAGGWGIMLDDLLAGIMAAATLRIMLQLLPA